MNIAMARIASVLALLAVLALCGWTLLLHAHLPLPPWAGLPVAQGIAVALSALALAFSTTPDRRNARRLAIATVVYAVAILTTWVITGALGPPRDVDPVGPRAWFAALMQARPPALAMLGVALFGGALWCRVPRAERADASAGLGSLAAMVMFLLFVGQCFDADALVAGPAKPVTPLSFVTATLLLALALAGLATHPSGPLAAYAGADPGAMTRRRLLPAAVLTPLASGFLLAWALVDVRLDPALAIALTVAVNVAVMLLLIHRVGTRLSRVAEDRRQRMRAREARVRKQGMRDALTGLLNRRGWEHDVADIENRCRAQNLEAGVIVIDLDGLKQVNDRQGHQAGDAYIQRAAGALRRVARRRDVLARLGGDEFAYLAVGCDDAAAESVMARLDASLRTSRVLASLGFAMRGRRGINAAIDEADAAMYAIKRERQRARA